MAEYIQENYSNDIESWESMTPRERLEEFLWNELNVDFSDDFFEVETVEQCIDSSFKSLKNKEFKDIKNEIEDTIKKLKTYEGKGLLGKFVMDKDSCLWSQGHMIFDENYKYIDIVRVI